MADFVSQYWSWYIAIPSVLGILGCGWLAMGNRGTKPTGGSVDKMPHIWDEDLQEYNNPLPAWWLNMFLITIVWGLIYLVLYPGLGSFSGTLGWTSKGQYEAEMAQAAESYGPLYARYAATDLESLAKDPDAMRTAERLYASYCSTCHGSDARGATGFPNLRDGDWLWGGEPAIIKQTIVNGRFAVMPAWGVPLGGDEGVADVAEYVISLSGREVDAARLESGRQKFAMFCGGCHGPTGTGNPIMGAPNLTDATWLYGGSRGVIRKSIASGRSGRMPAHGEFLGNDKVHLLAAYVLSLAK